MMNTPTVMPLLRVGTGETPEQGGCALQVVHWLHDGGWTDDPPCIPDVLKRLIITTNDSCAVADRHRVLLRALDVSGAPDLDRVGLVRWAADVAQLLPQDEGGEAAVAAARAWADCPCEDHSAHAARAAASANYATASDRAAAHAAYAAAAHADYATYADYAIAADYASASAAYASSYAADPMALFDRAIDLYLHHSGWTPQPCPDLTPVVDMLGRVEVDA